MKLTLKVNRLRKFLSQLFTIILVAPLLSFLPIVLGSGLLPAAQAAQYTWTNPTQTPSGTWHALAMSSDGTKLVGGVYGGGIWTSSDSGATWLNRSGAGNRNWTAVAVSQTSDSIYGVDYGGGVYRSPDFGVTWAKTSAPNCNYVGVATSGATNVSAACGGSSGKIYVNTNAGIGDASTWTVSEGTNNLNFTELKSSSDGTKLIASVWAGGVYMATDGVFSYVNKMSAPLTTYLWSAVGINSDGTKLIATSRGASGFGSGGNVYTSTDAGTTWTASSGINGANRGQANGDWMNAAISADGSTLVAVAFDGPSGISVSRDGGATWALQQNLSANFIEAVVCGSGARLAVNAYGGRIFQTVANESTLSGLAVSYGTLSSTFNSCNTSYTATVANSVSTGFAVTPTKSQSAATTVQYLGATGTTPFTGALSVGANVIRTIVTSQDGASTSTYTVTVTREAGTNSDASLSDLDISSGTLSPAFTVGTSSYTASVANSVSTGFTITPTKSQSAATTVQYLGATGTTAFAGNLSVGANVIRTVVTAQNGTTQQTYTVTVTRAGSADATLTDLSLSSGTLSPVFASETSSYTASVANSVSTGFTVTPTKSQSAATTIQYLGATGTTVFAGNLSVGANIIRTVVTAQDGTTTNTYTVTVTRAAQFNSITWNDQGATAPSSGGSTSYANGSAVATIPTTAPQKTGYTFVGWFTSSSSGAQITNNSFTPASPYGDLTFYAHWSINKSSAIANWAWVNQSSAGARNWHALATSADGSKLFAGVDSGGSLYRSTDFGVTWSSIADTSGRNWFSIASNLDGTKVAAVDRGGDIWTSVDSGSTWTQRVVGGAVRNWESIASSSDGLKLVAVASNGSSNGFIYTSADSGATWSSNLAPSGNNKFTGVTSSNDGTYLAATTWTSGIFTSNNSGQTWTLRAMPVPNVGGETHLQAVASSGDGSRLVTGSRLSGASNGGIIFTSADYGASWKAYSQTTLDYINFTSNGDGSRLAATIYGQAGVSTSADFGASWTFQSVGASGQISIASNIDGSLLFVGGYGGNLWTGKVPNSRVVAVLPSATSANIAASANTPATAISFSAGNAVAAMTVIPIANPTSEASTPFNIAQASVFDISVVNVSGQVTICVDGGPNVRLWHYINGGWEDVTTSQTATQTCGLASSFSPFATGALRITSTQIQSDSTAAAKAAAEAAAAKREAEIKTARQDISNKLMKSEKLTIDSFRQADIAGVTAENFAQVQEEILALSPELRTDINQILKVARKYEVVGIIASGQTRSLPISTFVELGLIPAESKNKVALIASVRRASSDERDSFTKIKEAIANEAAKITARKDRLASVITRIKSRIRL
jgi:uncharacterized repeat protein (TIGR02543 family)